MSTMKEIAQSYKKTSAMLRIAIQDCDMEIDAAEGDKRAFLILKRKSLHDALEQTRDLYELCEHYYDSAIPTRMSPYTSIGIKAPKFDATKK